MTANDKKFSEWMQKVDSVIQKELEGLSAYDLPDTNWRDLYEAGEKPETAAQDYVNELQGHCNAGC